MATATERRRTGLTPVRQGVAQVHAVIDRMESRVDGPVSGHEVAEVERAIARLEAVKLRMVAAADREDAAACAGMSGTSAWLAAHTRSWGAKAAADVSLATALDEGLPVTKEALASGAVSVAHAAVIAGAASRLPASLTRAERTKVEAALVAQAKRLDPGRLRRAARRALLAAERSAAEARAHEDAELRGEESRAEARVRLTMHDNHDGTVSGHFTVPTLAGAILRKTIQQMVSPADPARPAATARSALPPVLLWGLLPVPRPRPAALQQALTPRRRATGPSGTARRSSSCSSTSPPTASPARSPPRSS